MRLYYIGGMHDNHNIQLYQLMFTYKVEPFTACLNLRFFARPNREQRLQNF